MEEANIGWKERCIFPPEYIEINDGENLEAALDCGSEMQEWKKHRSKGDV